MDRIQEATSISARNRNLLSTDVPTMEVDFESEEKYKKVVPLLRSSRLLLKSSKS